MPRCFVKCFSVTCVCLPNKRALNRPDTASGQCGDMISRVPVSGEVASLTDGQSVPEEGYDDAASPLEDVTA